MAWAVLYDDGRVLTSEDTSPGGVRGRGVVCIAQPNERSDDREIMHGWDWYYWVEPDQRWWGSDIYGLLDRLTDRLPTEHVCQGRSVTTSEYQRLMARAVEIEVEGLPKRGAKRIPGETPRQTGG